MSGGLELRAGGCIDAGGEPLGLDGGESLDGAHGAVVANDADDVVPEHVVVPVVAAAVLAVNPGC